MKSALLFALAAPLVFAANTFVGCLGQPTEDISNPFPDDTVAVADGVTQAACDPICHQGDYADLTGPWEVYFAWPESPIDASNGFCMCSYTGPTSSLITPGTALGECEYGNFRLVNNPWDFRKCLSAYSLPGSSKVQSVAGPAECFSACAGWDYVMGKYTGGGMECTCADSVAGGVDAGCDSASVYVWTSEGLPSVSGLRRRALQVERARQRRGALCPRGMSACIVAATDEYECLDTRSELESCGGCVYGQFNPVLAHAVHFNLTKSLEGRTAHGEDCTALPGIHPSGVRCVQGTCVVSACRGCFVLEKGACVEA